MWIKQYPSHLRETFILTVIAASLTFIPWTPIAIGGGITLLILLPGWQLTHWLGLWRGWNSLSDILVSIGLGLASSSLLLFWSGWLFGLSKLTILISLVLFIGLMAWLNHRSPDEEKLLTTSPPALNLKIFLSIVTILSLSIILVYTEGETELGSYPIQMGDWVKHHGVAWSLRYTGIPPQDVFFAGMNRSEAGESLVYYYFFHLLVASLDILANVSHIKLSFIILSVISAISFAATLYLFAHRFFQEKLAATMALLFATLIGGLDVIPSLHKGLIKNPDTSIATLLPASLEHIDNWTPTQHLRLSSFPTHYLWVPQHLTGLLMVILGLYLYKSGDLTRRKLIIFSLLIAVLLGYSTWIAVIVYITLPIFALYQIRTQEKSWEMLGGYALVAVGAGFMILPFALTLLQGDNQAGIVFEIPRNMSDWSILTPFSHRYPQNRLAQLLDLPIHYFVEMGALLIGGLLGWGLYWRRQTDTQEKLFPFLSLLILIGFGTISFFAAGRAHAELGLILNNDLGLRAIMPAQMALALFAGYYLSHILKQSRWQLLIFVPLLILGLTSFWWEVMAMGITKYYHPPQVPSNVLQAFEALPQITPRFSIIQHRTHNDFSRVQPGYAQRFNGYSTSEAISVSNEKPQDIALAIALAEQAFANTLPLRSYQISLALGADYLFVGPNDQPARASFEQDFYFKPVYHQDEVSIFKIMAHFQDRPLATFDQGAIEYRGYFVEPSSDDSAFASSVPQNLPGLVTAWRLTHPTDKNYTIYIHFLDEEGNILAQADHQLWAWDVNKEGPTTLWTPHMTHLDIVPLPVEAIKAVKIRFGLWLSETGEQFPATVLSQAIIANEAGQLIIETK